MIFGSHLYGTHTEESDQDFKGVFMPSKEEILLGRVPKSINLTTKKGSEKNTPDDVDTELYSLHYFVKLACEGETVAMDMLHAPGRFHLETSDVWSRILSFKYKFYSKNLKAFVGYARRQAAKYGIKGSRIQAMRVVFDSCPKELFYHITGEAKRLADIWDHLPEGEHIHKHPASVDAHNNLRMYEVCGKKVQETATVEYLHSMMKTAYLKYGERAMQAANNENIDWKAVSHALRAAYQVRELLSTGTMTLPLPNAIFLREVKQGIHDYKTKVAPLLDELIEEVELIAPVSDLPDKSDRKFWDKFVIEEVERCYFGKHQS